VTRTPAASGGLAAEAKLAIYRILAGHSELRRFSSWADEDAGRFEQVHFIEAISLIVRD
jgi:hypothetical protein